MVDLASFKVYNYPDGHKHVVSDKDLKDDHTLEASIRNFDDLFLIAQIKKIHPEITHLYIRYLLAGRCDRRFSPGEAVDLEIVCDFISSIGFQHISVLKPHSNKTMDLLQAKNMGNVHAEDMTKQLLRMCEDDIAPNGVVQDVLGHRSIDGVCYVSPDAGASSWIRNTDRTPIIQGSKKRDEHGTVVGVKFEREHACNSTIIDTLNEHIKCKHFVIIDDLCDGGATFINIAKTIKSRRNDAVVYLVVTHAIFSKGFTPFVGWIDRIYCTNSFADWEHPLVRQLTL